MPGYSFLCFSTTCKRYIFYVYLLFLFFLHGVWELHNKTVSMQLPIQRSLQNLQPHYLVSNYRSMKLYGCSCRMSEEMGFAHWRVYWPFWLQYQVTLAYTYVPVNANLNALQWLTGSRAFGCSMTFVTASLVSISSEAVNSKRIIQLMSHSNTTAALLSCKL